MLVVVALANGDVRYPATMIEKTPSSGLSEAKELQQAVICFVTQGKLYQLFAPIVAPPDN